MKSYLTYLFLRGEFQQVRENSFGRLEMIQIRGYENIAALVFAGVNFFEVPASQNFVLLPAFLDQTRLHLENILSGALELVHHVEDCLPSAGAKLSIWSPVNLAFLVTEI